MELFSPFKNNGEKKNCFLYIALSIVLFFLFDYCYQLNILYLRDVEYYGEHTIPAFLYSVSNIPFLLASTYTLAKFSRGIAEWFKYLAAFIVDVCIVYILFAFRDPSQENTRLDILILVSLGVFLLKLFLFKKWRRFRTIKIV